MTKISVITVLYNAQDFLEKTILSIVNQQEVELEYVIVDGKSKDGTVEIIKDFERRIAEGEFNIKKENFHWISEPDTGLYDAMNKGMAMATSDFVWFINAGDKIYDHHTAQKIDQAIANNPQADVVYGQSLIIDQNDNPVGERHKIAPKKLSKKSLLNGLVVCHQSILVRKEIASDYNLDYRVSADFDWVCNALSASQKNVYIDDYISRFMLAGFSTVNRKKSWEERYRIMKIHFGAWKTFWAHLKIALKYPFTRKY